MNRRHLRPTEPPAPPPPTPAELPDHLVATPLARGLRRLGVGTVPFSMAAMATLVAMSAVVVTSPTSLRAPASGAASELAMRDRPPATDSGHGPVSADAAEGTTSTTVAAPASAAPATAPPSSDAPTTTAKATRRPTSDARLASFPVSSRVVLCDDFSLQPEAQAAFDADPVGRATLDGDHDGVACEHLPGRGAAPAPTVRRVPSAADLRRPSTRLYGVHTPNAPYATSETDNFVAAAGKMPNTVLFFQNFSQEFPATAMNNASSRGMLPMVTFEPIVQNSSVGQPKLADITAGDWDVYLTRWATAAKADGRPIAFRFAQEMNGNWYSWSDGRFGNAAGEYVRAWRHIHRLFDDVGADNLIWVWSVNRIDNLPDKTLARVYPGDEWVDWVGLSGYLRQVPDGVAPTFDFTFGRTLAAVKDVAPSKLVMLTEVGAGTTESNRITWLQSFFRDLLEHPEIIGFNWFNDFKDGGDWRIQYSAATSAAFATGVADSRYGEVAPVIP